MIILKTPQILPFIAQYLPENPIIIEAGAFNGNDTKKLSSFWPQATIYAFEPVPEIFALLQEATKNLANVQCCPYALSNQNGDATFYVAHKPNHPERVHPGGSLLKPKERLNWSNAVYDKTISVPTLTLDTWAQQQGIKHIDFLWLDMQGNELAVMQTAPEILATVRVIFTEVEFVHAYEQSPLYPEVEQWLNTQGFKAVARDFETTTKWFFGNMIFVRV